MNTEYYEGSFHLGEEEDVLGESGSIT